MECIVVGMYLSDIEALQANLNKMSQVALVSAANWMSFERHEYEYPDADLCLFKELHYRVLFIPHVYAARRIDCTCTLKLIHSLYVDLPGVDMRVVYDDYIDVIDQVIVNMTSVLTYCKTEFVEMECDFKRRLLKCESPSFSSDSKLWLLRVDNDMDLVFLVKWVQYVLLLIAQPVLCVLSIVNNVLVRAA